MAKKKSAKEAALKPPTPLTRVEKSTLAKILAKARAYQAFYRNGGKR